MKPETITDSELMNALKNSMTPIFKHFEEVITESGGSSTMVITISAEEGGFKLSYGFTGK